MRMERTNVDQPAAHAGRYVIDVVIATTGRRDIVGAILPFLQEQVRRPDRVIVSASGTDDFDPAVAARLPWETLVLHGPRGLCRQRNRALAACEAADIVVFLDDDTLLAPDYLENAERLLMARPDIVVLTGTVVADGATGPGISIAEGRRRLLADGERRRHPETPAPTYGGYGCNMAVRMAPVRAHSLRFDERLPLYGWMEDIDFSRSLAPHGTIMRSQAVRCVHLGTKSGRGSGVSLGYSQIANPVYMIGKKSMSVHFALKYIVRNVMKNIIKVWRPEPWVDRRGRLRGNTRAVIHLASGRLQPEKALEIR